ncbi:tumor necrosis factor receptor superfamily member 6-like isoform X2 [Betta splendens]|uniref:Tumor necrosis factor receptor superfamily member 6 n=1 Tax=Betta splendens TaxID=158456 RepID=A0A6P7KLV3_BETSP|nr:tumor necrosis factor receptor superfamily member 6-like isoform X2 [Betta splendens]
MKSPSRLLPRTSASLYRFVRVYSMMASGLCFAAWVLLLAVFTHFVSQWACSASSHQHGNARDGLSRSKRSACVDGTYVINGRTCCRCAAGQYRSSHCSDVPNDTKCTYCERGTYNSEPNSDASCQPCRSCDHQHAGLEVDEPCTSASNTKCRCAADHYCDSGDCKVCQPCRQCGSEGVQSPCTPTLNTVCKGDLAGVIAGSVVGILLAAALAVTGFLLWRNKKRNNRSLPVSVKPEEELPLIDLYPHLPDIADTIGWKEMERLAMRSGIPKNDIESCKLNRPNDVQSQTLELLKIWTEKNGREASRKLIQMLNNNNMRDKSEAVKSILRKEIAAASNHSV